MSKNSYSDNWWSELGDKPAGEGTYQPRWLDPRLGYIALKAIETARAGQGDPLEKFSLLSHAAIQFAVAQGWYEPGVKGVEPAVFERFLAYYQSFDFNHEALVEALGEQEILAGLSEQQSA